MMTLLLLLLAAEVNAPVEMLAKASRLGDLKTADMVLSTGVNPNVPDRFGVTALYYAAGSNENPVLGLLLAYHADPNAQVNPEGRRNELYGPVTPLQYAASLGNNRTVARLIAAGAKIDTQGPAGRSALHFSLGHLDVMRYLISQGADVNARDVEGTSALDDAVWRGSLDAAAILLAHGAKLNEGETKSGATPLNEAAYRGKTEIVRYLLQFKPDLEIADKRGFSPLENAIRMGHEDAAVLLLDAEPKERKTAEFLEKTMEAAIRKDEAALVESLFRQGASLKGTSLLEDAALRGSEAIVGVLLEHGAAVDEVNEVSGTTALYAAASFGKGNVVETLLLHGAKPNLCGRNQKTAYRAAMDGGFDEVAALIQSSGGGKSCEPAGR